MASSTPKAVLYHFSHSCWASAAILALEEKGYGEDEVELKSVNLVKGEAFAPTFLRLNPAGSLPTLVVPTSNTLDAGTDTRYRAVTDTKSVLEFLDKGRSALSKTHTTSNRPAPSLSPATIEANAISNAIIDLVHLPENDPNFFLVSAKDETELKFKGDTFCRHFVTERSEAMEGYLASEGVIPKVRAILEAKKKAAQPLLDVYTDKATPAAQAEFFNLSKTAWEVSIPTTFAKLEELIAGPYALGDQLSLADLHLGVWMARLLFLATFGETNSPETWGTDLSKLSKHAGPTLVIGPKVTAFWQAFITRESFKKVYGEKLH